MTIHPITANHADDADNADEVDERTLDGAVVLQRRAAAVQRRAARRAHVLTTLLGSRPELRGAYAPADMVDEAVRWTA